MPALQISFVPWGYDSAVVAHALSLTQLHESHAPTILALAQQATQDGSPINRPVWWIDPTDQVALGVEDQFLLGDDILVAPVLEEGAVARLETPSSPAHLSATLHPTASSHHHCPPAGTSTYPWDCGGTRRPGSGWDRSGSPTTRHRSSPCPTLPANRFEKTCRLHFTFELRQLMSFRLTLERGFRFKRNLKLLEKKYIFRRILFASTGCQTRRARHIPSHIEVNMAQQIFIYRVSTFLFSIAAPRMATAEKFCLRWNDFESNISVAFRELREEKDFFDVTLACEDSQVQAHKVILSACSPFFRSVLRKNPHAHPLLYLKGVKYQELLSVLNFMYMGEVNVAQEELNSFLAVAEELRVKGLTQGESGSGGAVGQEPPGRGRQEELGKILEVAAAETVKTEPREVQPPYSQPANRQPYNQPTSRQTYSQPASRQPYSQSVSRQPAKQQPFGASSHASPEPYSGSPGGQAGLEPYGEELEAGGYGEESALATEETYQGEEEEYGEYGADFGNGYGEQADYSASGAGAAGGPSAGNSRGKWSGIGVLQYRQNMVQLGLIFYIFDFFQS